MIIWKFWDAVFTPCIFRLQRSCLCLVSQTCVGVSAQISCFPLLRQHQRLECSRISAIFLYRIARNESCWFSLSLERYVFVRFSYWTFLPTERGVFYIVNWVNQHYLFGDQRRWKYNPGKYSAAKADISLKWTLVFWQDKNVSAQVMVISPFELFLNIVQNQLRLLSSGLALAA